MDHQFRFRCNRSTTVHIFCICQVLVKKLEYSEACFISLYISREPMIRFGGRSCLMSLWLVSPMKLVRLITMCLNETIAESG